MNTTKYFLFTALGVAAMLLLTSDRANQMRQDMEKTAKKNAKKLKNKLARINNGTSDTLADLKHLLSNEIEGLGDDARSRIENIMEGTTTSASKIKRNLKNQLS
jgi:gas vesicle protein